MNIVQQRNIILEIFKSEKTNINLYTEYDTVITNKIDLLDINAFLDNYSKKHDYKFFDINLDTGDLSIIDNLLPVILKNIFKLNPGNFERLSSIICKIFGFTNNFITKGSHDQGIDFIATKDLCKDIFGFSINHETFIFGQTKRNRNELIDIAKIRELVGSIRLFRSREFSINNKKIYMDFDVKTHSTLFAFFTTSYFFSEDACNLCASSHIINLDLIDISIIISKGITNDKIKWTKNNKFRNSLLLSDLRQIEIAK